MKFTFNAYHFKKKLKLKELEKVFPFKPYQINPDEIVYKVDEQRFIFLYRFGSIVFFNISRDDQNREFDRIANSLDIDEEISASEEFYLEDNSEELTITFDTLKCSKPEYETVYLASFVLAQSVALEYFENLVDDMLERSRKITRNLETTGKIKRKIKDLVKYIGFALTTRQVIVSKLYILDKPEMTWDNPALEKLYTLLSNTFELKERYKMLDYKFDMIQDSLEILSDLIKTRKETILELLIIILIFIEVVLFVYELFVAV